MRRRSIPWRLLTSGAGGDARSGEFVFLPKVVGDAVDDFRERRLRAKAGQCVEFIHAGDAEHHVLKARLVSLLVGNVFNARSAAGALLHEPGQSFDGDLLRVADVYDFSDRAAAIHEANETFDGIPNI